MQSSPGNHKSNGTKHHEPIRRGGASRVASRVARGARRLGTPLRSVTADVPSRPVPSRRALFPKPSINVSPLRSGVPAWTALCSAPLQSPQPHSKRPALAPQIQRLKNSPRHGWQAGSRCGAGGGNGEGRGAGVPQLARRLRTPPHP